MSTTINWMSALAVFMIPLMAGIAQHTVLAHDHEMKTLVVLGAASQRSMYSGFFEDLREAHHEVDFVESSNLKSLFSIGERVADNLILFDSRLEFNSLEIEEFLQAGGNVLAALDDDPGFAVRDLTSLAGFDIDPASSIVVDSVNAHDSDASHTIFSSDNFISNSFIVDKSVTAPVLFKGIGMSRVDDVSFGLEVLKGSTSTYTRSSEGVTESSGPDVLLVTAAQARNNARIVISGSQTMFSDAYANMEVNGQKSGNRDFVRSIALWAFQQRGLLKAENVRHFLTGGDGTMPRQYTIKDRITYEVDLSIYDGASKTWSPYIADDVQLEMVMLDPYIRTKITGDGYGHYHHEFMVPDTYGVFKLRVQYRHEGVSNLDLETIVAIHPTRHDEFERFIPAAYPYYTSAFSMMIGFFAFSIIYLYHQDAPKLK